MIRVILPILEWLKFLRIFWKRLKSYVFIHYIRFNFGTKHIKTLYSSMNRKKNKTLSLEGSASLSLEICKYFGWNIRPKFCCSPKHDKGNLANFRVTLHMCLEVSCAGHQVLADGALEASRLVLTHCAVIRRWQLIQGFERIKHFIQYRQQISHAKIVLLIA